MLLNGIFIDAVTSWNTKFGTNIAEYMSLKQISSKSKISEVTHRANFIVHNRKTAKELDELFESAGHNLAIIEGLPDSYNGVYELSKGKIQQKRGTTSWEGQLWLSNKAQYVRFVEHQENFDTHEGYNLQAETDDYTALLGYSGSGTNDGANGFYCTTLVQWGYSMWTHFELNVSVKLSGANNYIYWNYVNSNNHYRLTLDYTNGDWEVHKVSDGTTEKLYGGTYAWNNTSYYDIKIIHSNGRTDIFRDTAHIITVYDYDTIGGQLGVTGADTTTRFRDVSVDRHIPSKITSSTGFDDFTNPTLRFYTHTRDGLLQNFVNYEHEVVKEVYANRMQTGNVRVWDTMDNDFSQWWVTPKPLRWQQVFSAKHEFIGGMFVENGLFGILSTKDNGIWHFVYDEAHLQGSAVSIDFKQNPAYEVWNSSMTHRQFLCKGMGMSNFDEDGLNFRGKYEADNDIVYNQRLIPEYTTELDMLGDRIDIEYVHDDYYRQIEQVSERSFLAGFRETGDEKPFSLASLKNGNNGYINYEIEDNLNGVSGLETDTDIGVDLGDEVDLVVISENGHEGALLYKDGLLEHQQKNFAWKNDRKEEGQLDIGDISNGVYGGAYPMQGNIRSAKHRHINYGQTQTRSHEQPLIWITFDENHWDSSDDKFENQGSGGATYDMGLSATADFSIEKNGRYNQGLKIDQTGGTSRYATMGGISIPTTGSLTAECWIKTPTSAPASGELWLMHHTGASSERFFHLFGVNTGFQIQVYNLGGALDAGSDYRSLTWADTTFYDGKWHHFAMQRIRDVGGNTLYLGLYVDGVLRASTTINTSTQWTPSDTGIINVELGKYYLSTFVATWDEYILHQKRAYPNEMSVFVPDHYNMGAWYTNAEVYTDDHGIVRRRKNPKVPVLTVEYNELDSLKFTDSENETPNSEYHGSNENDIYFTAGKSGIGMGKTQSGNRLVFDMDTKMSQLRTAGFTIQMYFNLHQLPSSWGSDYHVFTFRQEGTSENRFDVRFDVNDDVAIYQSGVTDVIGAMGVAIDTINHFAVTYEPDSLGSNSGTAKFYINDTLIGSTTIDGLYEQFASGTNTNVFSIFESSQPYDGWLSNITIHQGVIPVSQFGITVDRKNSIPSKYHKFRNIQMTTDLMHLELESISEDLVEMTLIAKQNHNPDQYESRIPAWIESGNYFFHYDLAEVNFNGETTYLQTMSAQFHTYQNPRFAVCLGQTTTFTDMSVTRAGVNFNESANYSEPFMMAFDFKKHRNIFVTGGSIIANTVNYYLYASGQKITEIQTQRSPSIQFIGYVPNIHTNHLFWDGTSQEVTSAVGENVLTGDWFKATPYATASYGHIVKGGRRFNYQLYPRGVYGIFLKGGTANAGEGWYGQIRKQTGDVHVKDIISSKTNTTSTAYFGTMEITSALENEELKIETIAYAGGTYNRFADYLVLFPISNGRDMPLDIVTQSLTKRYKEKLILK